VQQPAIDRKPDVVEIQIGQQMAHALAVQQFRIVTLVDHHIAAPRKGIALAVGMKQVDQPACRMHRVIVQVFLQTLPQLERMGIKLRIALLAVICPHDGGVAPHVAATQIALFQHRDIGHAVVLGQVIGRAQPVTAAADDDGIIFRPGLGIAPMRAPPLVAGQAFAQDTPS
jgi:hypothetical protein